MAALSNANPEVDAWLEQIDHPLVEAMRLTRRIILGTDARITESIKWSTPTFAFQGNIASFQPRAKNFVSLLFHRGAEIPGDHPRLEGDAPLARVMRFRDVDEVQQARADLEAVIRAWCASKSE